MTSDITFTLLSIKKRVAVIIPIAIIFMYSARKIRTNVPELYSVLNPDTNSDSPSAKSNGVRFVSAKVEINHVIRRGLNIIVNMNELNLENTFKLNEESKIIGVKIIKAILTS